jgi:hypothetical protein
LIRTFLMLQMPIVLACPPDQLMPTGRLRVAKGALRPAIPADANFYE